MQGNSIGCWSFVKAEFQEVSFADSESEHGYSGRLRCDFDLLRHCTLRLINFTGLQLTFHKLFYSNIQISLSQARFELPEAHSGIAFFAGEPYSLAGAFWEEGSTDVISIM